MTSGRSGADSRSTMPLKQPAIRLCESVEPLAEQVDAVNTMVRTQTGWSGHNTDVGGCVDAVRAAGLGLRRARGRRRIGCHGGLGARRPGGARGAHGRGAGAVTPTRAAGRRARPPLGRRRRAAPVGVRSGRARRRARLDRPGDGAAGARRELGSAGPPGRYWSSTSSTSRGRRRCSPPRPDAAG